VSYNASRRHLNRGVALSYARIFLSVIILIAVVFFLLKVAIVAAIFGVFALIVLIIVLKEGL
jgi:membrane protein required for beta-lactamase induction